jgi:hypothetical protein
VLEVLYIQDIFDEPIPTYVQVLYTLPTDFKGLGLLKRVALNTERRHQEKQLVHLLPSLPSVLLFTLLSLSCKMNNCFLFFLFREQRLDSLFCVCMRVYCDSIDSCCRNARCSRICEPDRISMMTSRLRAISRNVLYAVESLLDSCMICSC